MSIRNPIDMAAAAITAASAVDPAAEHDARRPFAYANTPVLAFAAAANAIRIGALAEVAPAAPAKKRIPGQIYH